MRWPDPPGSPEPLAWFGDCLATGLADVTSDPAALDSAGWWAVVADFEGGLTCARFADVRAAALPAAPWPGPDRSAWASSLSRDEYVDRGRARPRPRSRPARSTRSTCAASSRRRPLPSADVVGLAGALASGNPAPYAGVLRLPAPGSTW